MKLISSIAVAVIGTALSSTAFAGCGKESKYNFPPLTPAEKALAREVIPDALPQDLPDFLKGITGLWLSTVTVGNQTALQAYEAFTSDGLEFLNDNGSPLAGNVCFGYWNSNGRNITVYHPSWSYDDAGNLIGTVVIKSQITLDVSGKTYKGTVSAEAFDLNGHSLGIVLQGTLTGKRISG